MHVILSQIMIVMIAHICNPRNAIDRNGELHTLILKGLPVLNIGCDWQLKNSVSFMYHCSHNINCHNNVDRALSESTGLHCDGLGNV